MKSVKHIKGVLPVLKYVNDSREFSYCLRLVMKIILLPSPVSRAVLYEEVVTLNKSNRRWADGFDWVLCI